MAVATGGPWANGASGCICTSERRGVCSCVLLGCGFGLGVPTGLLGVPKGLLGGAYDLLGGPRDIDMRSICCSKLCAPIKRAIGVNISGVA